VQQPSNQLAMFDLGLVFGGVFLFVSGVVVGYAIRAWISRTRRLAARPLVRD
jgi:hypothetical protein